MVRAISTVSPTIARIITITIITRCPWMIASYTGTDYARAYDVEGEVVSMRIFNNIGTVTRSSTGRKHGLSIGDTNKRHHFRLQ